MADGSIKIKIEIDGKEVNIASKELENLGDAATKSGQGAEKAENDIDGLGKGTKKASISVKDLAISLGLVKIASVAFNVLKSSMDAAITRFDRLNQFPRVLQNLGVSAQDTDRAMTKMLEGISNLPIPLEEITSTVQRMYTSFDDIDKSVDTAIALSNALIGSGSSAEEAKRGTDQYIKALQTGRFDMNMWTTLQETMSIGLNELAKEFGFTGASAQQDLYKALQNGKIPMNEFNDRLIEIGTGTGRMAELAKESSAGIGMSLNSLKGTAARGMASIIESFDNLSIKVSDKSIAQHIESLRSIISAAFKVINNVIASSEPVLILFISGIQATIPVVKALTPAIVGLMTAYAAYTVITKASAAIQASNAILNAAKAAKEGLTLVTKANIATTTAETGAVTIGNVVIGVMTGQLGLLAAAKLIATAAAAKFSAAIAFLSGPIGWVVAGIGLLTAATVAIVKHFKEASEEANRLNAETESLEESTNSLNESINSSSQAHQENQTSIKASADANAELASKVEELAEKENKSAAEKQLLNQYIEQLNGSVEGLNLAYNEEANALSMSSEEMAARIELMKEQEVANASMERLTEILQEQSEVEQKLAETNELREEWNQKLEEGSVKSREHKDAIAELDEQEQLLNETTAQLAEQQKLTEEQMTASMEAITEATESGISSQILALEDLSESQQATVEAMKSTWEDYKSAATDMFDTLNDEITITAAEMKSNLEENQRVISEWSDNIAKLAERGVDEGLLETLREAGPKSAGHVNALVNASDTELAELSAVFAEGGNVATDALSKSLGIKESGVMDAVGNLVTDTESTLKKEVQAAGFDSIGIDVADGLAGGIEKGSPKAENASKSMADDTTKAAKSALGVRSPSTVFREIGTNITEGLVLGINSGTSKVTQAIQKMFKAVENNSTQSFSSITRSYDNAINQIDRSLSRLPIVAQTNMTNMSNAIQIASASQVNQLKVMTQNYDREVDNIDKSLKKLPGMAQQSMTNMLNRLKSGGSTQTSYMRTLSTDLRSPFNNLNSQFNSIGQNAMNGLNAGLNARRNTVMNTARSIANSVASTMRNALKIQSPSKVMRDDIGKMIPAGIALGIKDYAHLIDKEMVGLSKMMVSTPEQALGVSRMAYNGADSVINSSSISNDNSRSYNPIINNHFTPAESTPSESARKQKQQQQRLAMAWGH